MSLNDAYDFVRRRKANISPNFNFMGQLLDFERQLNPPSPQRCTCQSTTNTVATGAASSSSGLENSNDNVASRHQQADDVVAAAAAVVLPLTRLSIDEKDEEALPYLSDAVLTDSGIPSSVSLSPCSITSSDSSISSPSLNAANQRLRTFVCRCQASLSQCHFTTPSNF